MRPAENEAEVYPLMLERYAVFEEIGRGGMARVHLARLYGAVGFSRIVALKRLRRDVAESDDRTRLIDEARLGARIRHPNIVSILDVVQRGDEVGVVMDYVHGPALAWLVRRLESRGERCPTAVTLRIMLDVLYGLHAAHEAKSERGAPLDVIHRDVSPQNILLGSDGLARVADFGIARSTVRLAQSLDGEVRGKRRYMAPEQRSGATLDRRVDVFGAGVVLWELLTTRPLFPNENALGASPIDAPSRHAALAPALDAAVFRMLAAGVADRTPTAEAAARAIEDAGMPIANHAEVARWLNPLAEDLLAERSALIENVEQLSRAFVASSPPAASSSAAMASEAARTATFGDLPARTFLSPAPATRPMTSPVAEATPPVLAPYFAATEPVPMHRAPTMLSPTPASPHGTEPMREVVPRRARRGPWLLLAIMTAVAIAAVVLLFAGRMRARRRGLRENPPTTPPGATERGWGRRHPRTSSSEMP